MNAIHKLSLLAVCFLYAWGMYAGDFSVGSFRQLPNDISAFINPVKDLNDEDCALIKIIAPEDFVFSSPLGIVKRIDKVGEIWLYLPRKSKMLTIKHPEYGVLRDYAFPEKIESHLTYEMLINLPAKDIPMDGPQTSLTTLVTDTLIVTKTDTVMLKTPKSRTPFSMSLLATATLGGNARTLMGGLMLTAMRAHGAYVSVSSDFCRNVRTIASSDKTGCIDGVCPFYSGHTRNSAFQVSGGAVHKISSHFNIFEGVGYGHNRRYWQKAASEGGGYVKNSHYSYDGVLIEAGVMASYRKLQVSASISTIEGSQWFGSTGVGIKF